MKKSLRKSLSIILTVALLAILTISPASTGVSAEDITTYQEPYVITTNPGDVTWDVGSANLIQNAGLEYGNVNDEEQSALGTQFLNADGFYKWNSSLNANVLRTANSQPITDYYYLTDEDKHTGNRSLKANHASGKDDWVSFSIYVGINNDRTDRLHDNTNYVLTFWAKTAIVTPDWATDGHYQLLYNPKNDTSTHLADQSSKGETWDWKIYASNDDTTDGTNDKFAGKYTSDDLNVWKQYSIVFNTGDNASLIKLRLNGLRGTVYYDDFALYELKPHVVDNNYGFFHYSSSATNAASNLITDNAGIEGGATGWLSNLSETSTKYETYSQYYSITAEEKHSGEKSLKYSATSDHWNGLGFWVNNLTSYTNYLISFWAKGSGSKNVFKFASNADYKTIKDFSGATATSAEFAINSNEWKQYTYLVNTANATGLQFWIMGATTTQAVYFDDFTLIPVSGVISYVAENHNTMETVSSSSAQTNFRYSTFDDAPEDSNQYSGYLYALREDQGKPCRNYYSISTEEAHSGTKSFKFTWDGSGDGSGRDFYVGSNSLEKGTGYILSFWVKGVRGTTDNNWKIVVSDAESNAAKDFSGETAASAQYRFVNTDGWHQYSYRIKTGNYNGNITVTVILLGRANTTLYFDDFSIVKADTVTYTDPTTPVKAKMSSGRVEIEKQDNILYYGVASGEGEYAWQTGNVFNWLNPKTEYAFAVKTNYSTNAVSGLQLTTYTKGDANYDGTVSIADMVRCYEVVNAMAEDADFNADTDNSGTLETADISEIRNILLNMF